MGNALQTLQFHEKECFIMILRMEALAQFVPPSLVIALKNKETTNRNCPRKRWLCSTRRQECFLSFLSLGHFPVLPSWRPAFLLIQVWGSQPQPGGHTRSVQGALSPGSCLSCPSYSLLSPPPKLWTHNYILPSVGSTPALPQQMPFEKSWSNCCKHWGELD